MKILLINNNPVVSRLTALSARKENVELDEIKNISELRANDYSIIFVDSESYNNDVSNIIRNSGVEKRVLFYSQGDEDNQSIFTQTILKPFLPSEVSEILRESKVSILKKKEKSQKEDIEKSVVFDDLVEENREKELELLNVVEKEESLTNASITKPAVALAAAATATVATVKRTISEKKDKFDEKLEEAFPFDLDGLSDSKTAEVPLKESDKKEEKKFERDMFELDDDLFELDEKKDVTKKSINSMDSDLFEIDKEIKKDILNNNAPLDFDLESKEEVSFEPKAPEVPKVPVIKEEIKLEKEPETTPPKEIKPNNVTKVLDNTEISNIKDILDEKEGAEGLTAVPASLMSIEKKIEEKNEEKIIEEKKELQLEEKPSEKKTLIEKTLIEKTVEKESLEENVEASSVKKKKKKKKKNSDKLSTGAAIAHTLSKLPVEDLRKLLRGAKVNVSIEFPNEL